MTVSNKWIIWLAGCCLVAVGLAVWPASPAKESASRAVQPYRGPAHRVLPVAVQEGAQVFRLSTSSEPILASPASPTPTLLGIAGGRAYLKTSSGNAERVGPGSMADGWRVVSVGSRSVTIAAAEKRVELRLFAMTQPSPGAPSPPTE